MLKKFCVCLILATATAAVADTPVVQNVKAAKSGGLWSFDVTILHTDKGWDDYVDRWRILDPQGNELGVRNLAHPHVNERPLTRALSGVSIPADVTEVGIQVHDTVEGWSTAVKKVQLR